MSQISILGCGWLGLPLAKRLIQEGYSVKGSTTSENKLSVLENAGIHPFLVALESESVSGAIEDFLAQSEILIIDIPPKLRGSNVDSTTTEKKIFVEKIKNLISFIEQSSVKKVLFVSSSSVYGNENSVITEETNANPETESGKQLLLAESLLQQNQDFQTTILRFGGLIGEDRHPVKFLAGKENLENPDAPVNLIHQNDCIRVIQEIIYQSKWNEVFNAVAPFHPTREEYYTQKAKEQNLILPKFSAEKTNIKKVISSEKIERVLNYHFKMDDY
ncbi:SDR family oxidoreductase [Flavobacterium sp. Fl-77]|uniref:SDR family oxidoreductase n=1 Tax=Flavobacterium flavipigmentatum TaxID=2893884 RepID=A0AAJ2VWS5_9FLAO|nr:MULTISPECIES: SDR family oxidoreductase [unclassified Flavobacterium]MDX6180868.1 SDR family oxidoreductase [Flavobacterium sp. Fl-33]MDX6184469.1 SDR family oxidoreductase [Flavobacterium sp. Fl-77]UFH39577.1 SDR family oxidoreductase [Flavobacterium sp. F-70]